jgi:hypothetical protein
MAGLDWKVVGAGDFNADGHPDLLWQNQATGAIRVWYMNGARKIGEVGTTPAGRNAAWQVVGTGDFDGDGGPDILVQNARTGQAAIWLMKGVSRRSYALVQPSTAGPYPDWKIVGVGDFNRDGLADILWEYRTATTAKLALWYMNGSVRLGTEDSAPPMLPDSGWRVAAVVDLDGDGISDVVWQHVTTAEVLVWHMNGASLAGEAFTDPTRNTDVGWRLVGPK